MKPDIIPIRAGEILFHEGDPSTGLYFVQSGTIEVFRSRDNIEILLDTLRPGDVLGTFTILSKDPRLASARAKEDCVLNFYSNDFFKQEFKSIPIWTQSVIKDAIARVKVLNEKLVESKIVEKNLQRNIGTVYHHCAQLAYLLASFMRTSKVVDDNNVPIFPVKNFLIQAEFILLKKFSYLEKMYQLFIENKLIKIVNTQKYGKVIEHPNPQVLEDFSNFSIGVVRKGTNYFVPLRFHKWILALIRISKKFNNLGEFERSQLCDLLSAEIEKKDADLIIEQLCVNKIIEKYDRLIKYSPQNLEKTIIFEGIARALKEITP